MRGRLTIALTLCVAGCAAADHTPAVTVVEPFEGVRVWPDGGVVEVDAIVCLDAGWLEQVACSPNTREHEALVVIETRPSNLHAALLMAGLQPGSPGRWTYENGTVAVTPPTGDALRIFARYWKAGGTVEQPIGAWMIGAEDGRPFPDDASWIFAGSTIAPNPSWMDPGEHYVADLSGSIIGLVTFGDEVIAFEEVMADQESVEPMQWRVNTDAIPPIGTHVTIILRARRTGG